MPLTDSKIVGRIHKDNQNNHNIHGSVLLIYTSSSKIKYWVFFKYFWQLIDEGDIDQP